LKSISIGTLIALEFKEVVVEYDPEVELYSK
jgi:hypothetical protein